MTDDRHDLEKGYARFVVARRFIDENEAACEACGALSIHIK
jgi:hypothetical protein